MLDNKRTRHTLYPPLSPYSTGFLAVDDIHTLYWEQSGNPDGVPVVFLHGGPGAGTTPDHRRFFDPGFYRIILFDQRGSGKSQPLAEIRNNTRANLVTDMELLRNHLRVPAWHVFGGSWGSTLALSYAGAHPKNCLSLILRGIFTLSKTEVEWFMHGIRNIFPEAWRHFAALIPSEKHDRLLDEYYALLCGHAGEDKMLEAGSRWAKYEGDCSSLLPHSDRVQTKEDSQQDLALARLEAHYFLHEVMDDGDSLLNQIAKIRHIPTTIIQGRYDIICPIVTADALRRKWPEADYIVVPNGGHSSMDPPIRERLVEATENAKFISI